MSQISGSTALRTVAVAAVAAIGLALGGCAGHDDGARIDLVECGDRTLTWAKLSYGHEFTADGAVAAELLDSAFGVDTIPEPSCILVSDRDGASGPNSTLIIYASDESSHIMAVADNFRSRAERSGLLLISEGGDEREGFAGFSENDDINAGFHVFLRTITPATVAENLGFAHGTSVFVIDITEARTAR